MFHQADLKFNIFNGLNVFSKNVVCKKKLWERARDAEPKVRLQGYKLKREAGGGVSDHN